MQKKAEETVLFLSCEKGISIGLEQGLERGAYQTKLETARNLLSEGWLPRHQPPAGDRAAVETGSQPQALAYRWTPQRFQRGAMERNRVRDRLLGSLPLLL